MKFAKSLGVRRWLLPAIVAAMLVSGCGGTSRNASHASPVVSTSGAHTTDTPPGAGPSAPASTAPASQTTTSRPVYAAPSGPPPCRAADLALSFLGGQGATGHGELGFSLRNTSRQGCSTVGFPGIQFLDQAGQPLPTFSTHTTDDFFGSVPEAQLNVAPGSIVSFRLGVTHGIASTVGCTTAYGLQVIPPNDTASLRTTIPNGAYECRTATVSPLARGASAYQ